MKKFLFFVTLAAMSIGCGGQVENLDTVEENPAAKQDPDAMAKGYAEAMKKK